MKKLFFLLAFAAIGFAIPSKAAILYDQRTINRGKIVSGNQLFVFLRADVDVVYECWTVKVGKASVAPAGISSAYIYGLGNFEIEYYALYADNYYVLFTIKGELVNNSGGGNSGGGSGGVPLKPRPIEDPIIFSEIF